MNPTRTHRHATPRALVAIAGMALSIVWGCGAQDISRLHALRTAYRRGDYDQAYQQAQSLIHAGSLAPKYKAEAAYIAGFSAYRLKAWGNAQESLLLATHGPDTALTGDALTMLGLIYLQQGQDRLAVQMLLDATHHLAHPSDRARAYFYAAKTQQRLGQWAQARVSLSLARSNTQDPNLKGRIAHQLGVTGFTLQVGAFTDQANARRAAAKLSTQATGHTLGPPRVLPAIDAHGKQLFLVQVGSFSDNASADRAHRTLGQPAAIVVPLTAPPR